MIGSFREDWVREIADGLKTAKARKNLPQELHSKAKLKIELIHLAGHPNDLRVPPGNRFESLKGKRSDEYSIRINDQWRIVFRYDDKMNVFYDVMIEDYH